MAAGAWNIYKKAKKNLMTGTLDLDTDTFKMALFMSASNAATSTLSTYASLTQQSSGGGYAAGGKTMSVTWTTGASTGEMRFDATAVIFTASGANLVNVKYAVIHDSTNILCFSMLSTSQFTVTSGNTLTVTPSANGIFELN